MLFFFVLVSLLYIFILLLFYIPFFFFSLTKMIKLNALTIALAVVFPSIAKATPLIWPVPQSIETGEVEVELDVSCSISVKTYH
jgi:hypothetical protein